MTPFIQMGLALIELAGEVAPLLMTAIKSSGELDDATRALLVARYDAARAKVMGYVPRDV